MHHGYTRHRSPDTLFSMAGAQVKRIVKDSVRRFKPPPSNSWYPRYFTCSEPSAITRLAVRTLHEYLTSAPHVFKDLSLELLLEEPLCVDVVLHPLLKSLEITQENLSVVLDAAPNIPNVSYLSLCADTKRQSHQESQLLQFMSSLTNLTALKLSCRVTDPLLAVLGLSCQSLKILDAEADFKTSITDRGLSFLAACPRLASVILNDEGTEFNEETRYQGLTGPGVAHLIMSCPNLTLLTVDPQILKEAILFIHSINYSNKTFPLKYLHLRYTNNVFLNMAAVMFPALTNMRLEEPVNNVCESLVKFKKLENLNIGWYSRLTEYPEQLKCSFERLTTLTLRNPMIHGFFDFVFLRNLGNWCVNLETFTVAIYTDSLQAQSSTFTSNQRIHPMEPFFPKLKSLMFEGDISIKMIETFLMAVRTLEKLSIYVHGFNFSSGMMDQLLLNLVKNGNLDKLEYLQCYHWEMSLETLLYLIDQSSLRTIWGLNLLDMTEESKETIRSHIRKNNLSISLCDGLAPDPTFGLQFLDKKLGRQIDRLHEHAHQLEMEHILVELSLL